MRKIQTRTLAWLLALLLAVGSLPAYALAAAETGADAVRDTSFFTPQPHTELNYQDIEYVTIDIAPLLEEIEALQELAQHAENAEALQERFLKLADQYELLGAMSTILENRIYADSKDEWTANELVRVKADGMLLDDAVKGLLRDILSSPCAEAISSLMEEAAVQEVLEYQDMSEEQIALETQDTMLQNEYRSIIVEPVSATVGDVSYTQDSADQAYMDGTLDEDTYIKVVRALAKEKNAELGDTYLEMVSVRNRIAVLQGFDSYIDYAYKKIYHRDYTPEEAAAFCEYVKQYIVPKSSALDAIAPSLDTEQLPEALAYSGAGMFDTLLPYFNRISDELAESASYIQTHGAYDLDPAPNKTGTAYSVLIPYYNMPFYFANSDGSLYDLTTAVHELGHNNQAYWVNEDWKSASLCFDTAEVHSQALELLMTRFYPELFESQAEPVAYTIYQSLLSSIVQGCLYDEFQRWVYTQPELTLQKINEHYRVLAEEYGLVDASDERTEMYGWYDIPHNFVYPVYYISYATSAAGAYSFWEEAQEDYFTAADRYLRFSALPNGTGFQNAFREVGLASPLSEEYLASLAETIHEKLLPIKPYTDVYADDPWGNAVILVTLLSLMDGVDEDSFEPEGSISRGEGMTVFARLADEREDAEGPLTVEEGIAEAKEKGFSDGSETAAPLTREQAVVMLWRLSAAADYEPEEPDALEQFSDGGDVSDWARDAMLWALDLGLIEAQDGALAPQQPVTRAELAELVRDIVSLVLTLS